MLSTLSCTFNSAYMKKNNGSYGYTDRLIENNIHYISFDTGVSTQRKTIVSYWHRRASEICGGIKSYTVFTEWSLRNYAIQLLDPNLGGPPYNLRYSFTGNHSSDFKQFQITTGKTRLKSLYNDKESRAVVSAANIIGEALDQPLTEAMVGKDPIRFVEGYAKCKIL